MEQRAVIKFNVKLGRSASETYILMKQVFGTLCLSKSNVSIWHKGFSDGRNTLEDDKHTGRPCSSKTPESIEKVREFVANNRSASLRMMAEVLHINKETIRTILHEDLGGGGGGGVKLNMTQRQSAKVPNGSQKTLHKPKKTRKVPSKIKTMLITFFDSRGIIHKEFVPAGQTITGEYYLNVLKRLIARIRRIRPEYHDEDSWCLLHDNAPSHSSLIVRRFLAKNNVCVLNHSPYSPDLAPCDFYLFPKIKLKLKGCFFFFMISRPSRQLRRALQRRFLKPEKNHCDPEEDSAILTDIDQLSNERSRASGTTVSAQIAYRRLQKGDITPNDPLTPPHRISRSYCSSDESVDSRIHESLSEKDLTSHNPIDISKRDHTGVLCQIATGRSEDDLENVLSYGRRRRRRSSDWGHVLSSVKLRKHLSVRSSLEETTTAPPLLGRPILLTRQDQPPGLVCFEPSLLTLAGGVFTCVEVSLVTLCLVLGARWWRRADSC
ncbi:hypothetical protein LAZ67_3006016 [Cordylochernes scorpioides]|uniref:Transposase n=1 Tax=Cordylochernes scorpioides TaxID=51811 RepID=A0ABY6KB79_9ARAC|nr:hypothetical protein LAZ67_3006016 [Cordylochernes scorpioides]